MLAFSFGAMNLLIYMIIGPLVFFGFAYFMASRPKWLDLAMLGAAALAIMFACLLRFQVEITSDVITLRRSCIGITFFRRTWSLEKTKIQVTGMGDWGEPGDWPAKFYCEIQPNGEVHQEIYVGLPSEAEFLSSLLNEQRKLFLHGRQS